MKKLMQEQREKFGNFEVIDFVDEGEIKRLRDEIDVEAPVELHWTWNYGQEVEELRNLYEKGKVNQWNAELDLDWDTPVSKDEWVLEPEGSMLAMMLGLMGADEATRKAAAIFDGLGLGMDLDRARNGRKIRAGKGTMRGRVHKTPKSILLVVKEKSGLAQAARNLPGVDVVAAKDLCAEDLAPGGDLGRLTVFTKAALEAMN